MIRRSTPRRREGQGIPALTPASIAASYFTMTRIETVVEFPHRSKPFAVSVALPAAL